MQIFLEKRNNATSWARLLMLGAALLLVLLISWFFFLAAGIEPMAAFRIIGEEIFLTKYGWQDLLVKAAPLMFIGLGRCHLASQMRLFGILAQKVSFTWVHLP